MGGPGGCVRAGRQRGPPAAAHPLICAAHHVVGWGWGWGRGLPPVHLCNASLQPAHAGGAGGMGRPGCAGANRAALAGRGGRSGFTCRDAARHIWDPAVPPGMAADAPWLRCLTLPRRHMAERVRHLGTAHPSGMLFWGGVKEFAGAPGAGGLCMAGTAQCCLCALLLCGRHVAVPAHGLLDPRSFDPGSSALTPNCHHMQTAAWAATLRCSTSLTPTSPAAAAPARLSWGRCANWWLMPTV